MRNRPKNGRKRMKNVRKSIVRKPAEKTPEVSGYLPALLWKRSRSGRTLVRKGDGVPNVAEACADAWCGRRRPPINARPCPPCGRTCSLIFLHEARGDARRARCPSWIESATGDACCGRCHDGARCHYGAIGAHLRRRRINPKTLHKNDLRSIRHLGMQLAPLRETEP